MAASQQGILLPDCQTIRPVHLAEEIEVISTNIAPIAQVTSDVQLAKTLLYLSFFRWSGFNGLFQGYIRLDPMQRALQNL